MQNNEFFKALRGSTEATAGVRYAYYSWENDVRENLDFPLLRDSLRDSAEVADFLTAIEQAGFKKFGYGRSTADLSNIVNFVKAGWKIAGVFEFNHELEVFGYKPSEGLLIIKN